MPELPEVQTVVNDLIAAKLVGETIVDSQVYWPKTIATPSVTQFTRHIKGAVIEQISRRAKYITIGLSTVETLLIHLRMTGHLYFTGPEHRPQKHEQVVFTLQSDRRLIFYDPRKFGRLNLTSTPGKILDRLGPEPLSAGFTTAVLARRLGGHKRMLKPLLLDQQFIAGLGNIYVDEALWESRLHPLRKSHTLTPKEMSALYRSIRKVLRKGLKNGGTTLGRGGTTFYSASGKKGRNRKTLKVFRRQGEGCPRCNTTIERLKVAQRSTFVCSRCQYLPIWPSGQLSE